MKNHRLAALLGALALGACMAGSAGADVAADARSLADRLPRASMATAPPAPVFEYPIHEDGGIIYDPLRREAESTGQLSRYTKVPSTRSESLSGPTASGPSCRVTPGLTSLSPSTTS